MPALYSRTAICCAILALAPLDAWAVGSTPVTVENSAANPAVTSSVDDPGRAAYQSVQQANCFSGGQFCIAGFSAVPPGHRLVIQHVSGSLVYSSPAANVVSFVENSQGAVSVFNVATPQQPFIIFDQPVLVYLDAGESPSAGVETGSVGTLANGQFTLTGYLLDCTITACAPIAQ
jgi:hypothetical protein